MAWLAAWITAVISTGGYAGVMVLMALESACLPIPSELIMPFAGYLSGTGRFSLWAVALSGALGCNLGSAVAYAIGYHGGRPVIVRYGRYVMATPADLDRAEGFFIRFGPSAVFVGRLLPLIRTFIALPAGIGRMKQALFHLYTFAGSFLWCLTLAYAGQRLGRAWNTNPALHDALHWLDALAVVAVAGAVAWLVWHRVHGRK